MKARKARNKIKARKRKTHKDKEARKGREHVKHVGT